MSGITTPLLDSRSVSTYGAGVPLPSTLRSQMSHLDAGPGHSSASGGSSGGGSSGRYRSLKRILGNEKALPPWMHVCVVSYLHQWACLSWDHDLATGPRWRRVVWGVGAVLGFMCLLSLIIVSGVAHWSAGGGSQRVLQNMNLSVFAMVTWMFSHHIGFPVLQRDRGRIVSIVDEVARVAAESSADKVWVGALIYDKVLAVIALVSWVCMLWFRMSNWDQIGGNAAPSWTRIVHPPAVAYAQLVVVAAAYRSAWTCYILYRLIDKMYADALGEQFTWRTHAEAVASVALEGDEWSTRLRRLTWNHTQVDRLVSLSSHRIGRWMLVVMVYFAVALVGMANWEGEHFNILAGFGGTFYLFCVLIPPAMVTSRASLFPVLAIKLRGKILQEEGIGTGIHAKQQRDLFSARARAFISLSTVDSEQLALFMQYVAMVKTRFIAGAVTVSPDLAWSVFLSVFLLLAYWVRNHHFGLVE